eukprot:709646_1
MAAKKRNHMDAINRNQALHTFMFQTNSTSFMLKDGPSSTKTAKTGCAHSHSKHIWCNICRKAIAYHNMQNAEKHLKTHAALYHQFTSSYNHQFLQSPPVKRVKRSIAQNDEDLVKFGYSVLEGNQVDTRMRTRYRIPPSDPWRFDTSDSNTNRNTLSDNEYTFGDNDIDDTTPQIPFKISAIGMPALEADDSTSDNKDCVSSVEPQQLHVLHKHVLIISNDSDDDLPHKPSVEPQQLPVLPKEVLIISDDSDDGDDIKANVKCNSSNTVEFESFFSKYKFGSHSQSNETGKATNAQSSSIDYNNSVIKLHGLDANGRGVSKCIYNQGHLQCQWQTVDVIHVKYYDLIESPAIHIHKIQCITHKPYPVVDLLKQIDQIIVQNPEYITHHPWLVCLHSNQIVKKNASSSVLHRKPIDMILKASTEYKHVLMTKSLYNEAFRKSFIKINMESALKSLSLSHEIRANDTMTQCTNSIIRKRKTNLLFSYTYYRTCVIRSMRDITTHAVSQIYDAIWQKMEIEQEAIKSKKKTRKALKRKHCKTDKRKKKTIAHAKKKQTKMNDVMIVNALPEEDNGYDENVSPSIEEVRDEHSIKTPKHKSLSSRTRRQLLKLIVKFDPHHVELTDDILNDISRNPAFEMYTKYELYRNVFSFFKTVARTLFDGMVVQHNEEIEKKKKRKMKRRKHCKTDAKKKRNAKKKKKRTIEYNFDSEESNGICDSEESNGICDSEGEPNRKLRRSKRLQ